MDKKNILLIIPNLDFGGAQTSFSSLSQELSKYYNVTNVVFNKKNAVSYFFKGPLLDLGVPGSRSFIKKIIYFFIRVAKLRRVKKENKIDVSISFLEGADYVNVLSSVGEKVILSVRGSKKFDQNIRGLLGFLRKKLGISFLYNRADAIVVVNNGIGRELREDFNIKVPVETIYNFYDLVKIQKLAQESIDSEFRKWAGAGNVICIVGRLAPEKGIDQFLSIFAALQRRMGNSLRLLLVGEGAYREVLIESCKQNHLVSSFSFNLTAEVVFIGYQANPHKFLKHCSWLILPSLHEGFPNVLLEAMSLGIPVIAADCPYGPREILEMDSGGKMTGYLLPILNSDEAFNFWIEKLALALIDNAQQLEFSKLGKIRANIFSKERALKQWINIIER